ncbi:MAG: binding-protein-dependent transport system inner rane component [Bacillota bacterium]|jgi:multiple sugar transport system permease protein|nr:binding-protein-dependent transport system inner rane component [Bacillota bacterium]
MRKQKRTDLCATIILTVLGVLSAVPLLITVVGSLMPVNDIVAHYTTQLSVFDIINGTREKYIQIPLIPSRVTLEQYQNVLVIQPVFLMLLLNSIKITVPVVLGNLLVSVAAAYGFTVWKWRHKEKVFLIYIIIMLMPLQAVLVPNYIIAEQLRLNGSYLAIILPGIFSPFGTFLLRQSLKRLPKDCLEAAEIDGAGPLRVFWSIVLPQMKSGMAALVMLVFIEYWNVVEQVIVFLKEYYKQPLSVFLSYLPSENVGLIFAASTVYMLVPLWFLALGQKDLERGIELSSGK